MSKFFFITLLLCQTYIYSQVDNSFIFDETLSEIVNADQAIIELRISSSHSTEDSTLNEQLKKVTNVLDALRKNGYTNKNIFHRSNRFDAGTSEKGETYFFAFQSYRILITDFNNYEKLKSELILSGVTGFEIIAFWKSDYEEIKNSLYEKVIKKATNKAKLFAKTIGAKSFFIKKISDKTEDFKIDDLLLFKEDNRFILSSGVLINEELTITSTRIKIQVNLYIDFTFNY